MRTPAALALALLLMSGAASGTGLGIFGTQYAAPLYTVQYTHPWSFDQVTYLNKECLRVEVRTGDVSFGGERAELLYQTPIPAGTTTTYYFYVAFDPSNYVGTNPADPNIFHQWHAHNPGGNPNVDFQIKIDSTVLYFGTTSGVITDPATYVRQKADLVPYQTAHWYSFYVVVYWSPNSDGYITVVVDGGAPVTINGANMYWSDNTRTVPVDVQAKQGIYRFSGGVSPGWPPSIYYETFFFPPFN